MVHGGCASVGCFAMTDPVVDEIWRLVTAALKGGQKRFHVHVFPFRMTEENLDAPRAGTWAAFWRDLKRGHDVFEATPAAAAHRRMRRALHCCPGAGGSDGSHEIDNELREPDAAARAEPAQCSLHIAPGAAANVCCKIRR